MHYNHDIPLIKDRLFSEEEGETLYESALATHLKKTYSDYITYVSPFFKKGHELCDVLIVIFNHVFIFSDKSMANISDRVEAEARWSNYYKELKKSERQLLSAKDNIVANIVNNELTLFIDKACTVEIKLIFEKTPIFYLISTLSGFENILKNGDMFPINHSEIQNNKKACSLINKNIRENFIHAFDINSLKLITEYNNTLKDLSSYLNFRKTLLTTTEHFILNNENSILFAYIAEEYKCEIKTDLSRIKFLECNNNYSQFLENFTPYLNKIKQFKTSSKIDVMFSKFAYYGQFPKLDNAENFKYSDSEYRVRFYHFQWTSRNQRIAIMLQIEETMSTVSPNKGVINVFEKDELYCIIIMTPPQMNESIENYKIRRILLLEHYCNALRNNYSQVHILGLALDHPYAKPTFSEELIFMAP